ncbi:MAG: hypothetical protein ABR95_03055 [Sphingobacteriales bacterium BACL12 MAG-120813-bin55]|nr:MAG: hypothetical protein ABR95_03055 [Sphingobacteriales bacterium BACL12 MAG-120813-bin55]
MQYWTYDGEKIKTIDESKAEIRNLKWSGDGALLATASEKLRLWNKEGELVNEKSSENLLWGIDWNTDGSRLVTTDEQGNIQFWNQDLQPMKQLKYGSAWSP